MTNQEILKKRFQSFCWRLGGMVVAFVLAFILQNLKLVGLNPTLTTIIGLIIGEVTKYYNIDLPVLKGKKTK